MPPVRVLIEQKSPWAQTPAQSQKKGFFFFNSYQLYNRKFVQTFKDKRTEFPYAKN